MRSRFACWLRKWADRIDSEIVTPPAANSSACVDVDAAEFEKMWVPGKPATVPMSAPWFGSAGTWTSSALPVSSRVVVIGVGGGGGHYSPPDDGPMPALVPR